MGAELYDKLVQIFPDLIGMVGVACSLSAYVLLQLRYWNARDLKFSCVNLMGSSCILFSLFYHWNISSVIIEVVWLMMSAYGVINFFRLRQIEKKKINPS